MTISIDMAALEDVASIAVLFNAYRVFYKQSSDLALAEKFIFERLKNNESVIFIAKSDQGDVLGFTQLYPNFSSVSAQRTWTLNDLFVAEHARKLGIGKELMNAAKEFAQQRQVKGIALETSEDNYGAQHLYESLGYEKETGFYHYFLTL